MAGGDAVREFCGRVEPPNLNDFWKPDFEEKLEYPWIRDTWRFHTQNLRSLLKLAGNPFMLMMLVVVYCESGSLPPNRGALFERFIKMLLAREQLADPEAFDVNAEGTALLNAIGALAWQMMQHLTGDQREESVQIAIDKNEVDLEEQQLKRAASASILETGAQIRFSHQLLQEYFVALGMRERLQRGELDATVLWPADRWWERSGWEESTIFAGRALCRGLYPGDRLAAYCSARNSRAMYQQQWGKAGRREQKARTTTSYLAAASDGYR
jgi:hypothetical protein